MEIRRKSCFGLRFNSENDICQSCGNYDKCAVDFAKYIENLAFKFGDN